MRAHVLLNLLNESGKTINCVACKELYPFSQRVNTEARMLFYHMTLKVGEAGLNESRSE